LGVRGEAREGETHGPMIRLRHNPVVYPPK